MSRIFFENACQMIRNARLRRGLTQSDIASMLNIPQTTISRIEIFALKTDLYIFFQVAEFLEIQIIIKDPGSNNEYHLN